MRESPLILKSKEFTLQMNVRRVKIRQLNLLITPSTSQAYALRGKDLYTYALCKAVRLACRPDEDIQTIRRI